MSSDDKSREIPGEILGHWVFPERLFFLDDDPVLYHYCTAETLLNILERKTLRFSDISKLNDAEERVWGYNSVFMECLNKIRLGRGVPEFVPEISEAYLDRLDQVRLDADAIMQPFACCFSYDGDSLSQWRAYSNDGAGYCIGIRKSMLVDSIPAQTIKVCYEVSQQLEETFQEIAWCSANFELDQLSLSNDIFLDYILRFVSRSVAFKNPAFRDEQEIRAVFAVEVVRNDGKRHFRPTGGYVGEQPVSERGVNFQARRGMIVPYLDLNFLDDTNPKLEEIHLGPKCPNSVDDVYAMVRTLGIEVTNVSVAGAAYR